MVVGTPTVGARGHRLEKTWVDTLQLEKDFKYFSGTISCMSRFFVPDLHFQFDDVLRGKSLSEMRFKKQKRRFTILKLPFLR